MKDLEQKIEEVFDNAVEGYRVLPDIDKERYTEIPGLEGPYQTMSGKPIYYDPKEGAYYDRDTDMYLTYDEFKKLDEVDKSAIDAAVAQAMSGAPQSSPRPKARPKRMPRPKPRPEIRIGGMPDGSTRGIDPRDNYSPEDLKRLLMQSAMSEMEEAMDEEEGMIIYVGDQKFEYYDYTLEDAMRIVDEYADEMDGEPYEVYNADGKLVSSGTMRSGAFHEPGIEEGKSLASLRNRSSFDAQNRLQNKNKSPKPKIVKPAQMDLFKDSVQNEGEAGDHDRMYKVVHAKKGMMDIKAKTSYEAAKKFAKEKGLKSTAGVDTHLYPLEEGKMSDLHARIMSADDPHDAIYKMLLGNSPEEKYIQDMYNDTSIEYGLHPDDDFEDIIDRMVDEIDDGMQFEGVAKFYDEYDTPVTLEVTDDKLLYDGAPIDRYSWSVAQSMLTPQMYKNAKSWDEVHAYLKRADAKGQLHQAMRATFEMNPEGITTEGDGMHFMVKPPNKNPKYKSNMPMAQPSNNPRINTDFYKKMQKSFQKQGNELPWWMREGHSPHKKGTKKYKAHMAAMHANEDVNQQYADILKSKNQIKINAFLQGLDPATATRLTGGQAQTSKISSDGQSIVPSGDTYKHGKPGLSKQTIRMTKPVADRKYGESKLQDMRKALELSESTDANTIVAQYTRACLDHRHNTWGKVCEEIDHIRSFVKEDVDVENVRLQIRKMHEQEGLDNKILVKENVGKLRQIVKDKSAMSVKFADGSMKVDMTTANIFLQVFDKVKDETQAKIIDKIQTKAGFLSVLDKMYSMIG